LRAGSDVKRRTTHYGIIPSGDAVSVPVSMPG
jgi:hypothetical protein